MSAFFKIHWTAFPVIPQLAEISVQLAKDVGVDKMYGSDKLLEASKRNSKKIWTMVMNMWRNGPKRFNPPPTWRSLLDIMRHQGLEELSVQMETHLTGEPNIASYNICCMYI